MNYNLIATFLLVGSSVGLYTALRSNGCPQPLKRGFFAVYLLLVLVLVGMAYSDWNRKEQLLTQMEKDPAFAAAKAKDSYFYWSPPQNGDEGRRYQVVKIGSNTYFVAIVKASQFPYLWAPSFRIEAMYADPGGMANFFIPAVYSLNDGHDPRKGDLFGGETFIDSNSMRASIKTYSRSLHSQAELNAYLDQILQAVDTLSGKENAALPYRIEFEYTFQTKDWDEISVGSAFKETGEKTFTWTHWEEPKEQQTSE
ncbi:hypothetical protein [Gorillibacterium massiliense]|uniref:hypothetical protein n=1 Tax=Gorillibacterium massiliense TaxID=1280390 RepID=UPI0004BB664B|nr:hypothetical protein [Gorillibacterium massiliense]